MSCAPAFRPALEHENRRKRSGNFGFSFEITNSEGPMAIRFLCRRREFITACEAVKREAEEDWGR
jgi:hypothetical protein